MNKLNNCIDIKQQFFFSNKSIIKKGKTYVKMSKFLIFTKSENYFKPISKITLHKIIKTTE